MENNRERILIEAVEWWVTHESIPGSDKSVAKEHRTPIRFYRDCIESWGCNTWFADLEEFNPLKKTLVTLSSGHNFMLDMSIEEFDKLMK